MDDDFLLVFDPEDRVADDGQNHLRHIDKMLRENALHCRHGNGNNILLCLHEIIAHGVVCIAQRLFRLRVGRADELRHLFAHGGFALGMACGKALRVPGGTRLCTVVFDLFLRLTEKSVALFLGFPVEYGDLYFRLFDAFVHRLFALGDAGEEVLHRLFA